MQWASLATRDAHLIANECLSLVYCEVASGVAQAIVRKVGQGFAIHP